MGQSFNFQRMKAILLLLLHLLAFSYPAPDPDTNLRLHLPPEGGQGGQPNTGGGFAADSPYGWPSYGWPSYGLPSRLCQPCKSTCLGNLFCCPVQKKCIVKGGP